MVSPGGMYTKHIYMGSQRIVSKIGDLESFGADPHRVVYAGHDVDGIDAVDFAGKYQTATSTIKERYKAFDLEYKGEENDDYVNGQGFCCTDKKAEIEQYETSHTQDGEHPEKLMYFYHSDHLGSSSLITNFDGEVTQHVEYIPYGEIFMEERNSSFSTPYLFNAKELDDETGLYYYGARYFDPTGAMWLSVDPMFEKNVGASVYNYCHGNPIMAVDPDGKTDFFIDGDYSSHTYVDDGDHQVIQLSKENFQRLSDINFDPSAEDYQCVIESGKMRDDLFPTVNNVLSGSQYVHYVKHHDCLLSSKEQNTSDISKYASKRIDMYNPNDNSLLDFSAGQEYLVSQLLKGESVITGVRTGGKHGNANGETGHFLNVCGMGFDSKGRNYFSYYDNANYKTGTNLEDNRFYLSLTSNGIPVWYDNTNVGVGGATQYIVTEVRYNLSKK